jgi:hypothetical protein
MTGSMGKIPGNLLKGGLGKLMDSFGVLYKTYNKNDEKDKKDKKDKKDMQEIKNLIKKMGESYELCK